MQGISVALDALGVPILNVLRGSQMGNVLLVSEEVKKIHWSFGVCGRHVVITNNIKLYFTEKTCGCFPALDFPRVCSREN